MPHHLFNGDAQVLALNQADEAGKKSSGQQLFINGIDAHFVRANSPFRLLSSLNADYRGVIGEGAVLPR